MDETPHLKLPYILAAQSQKHVTHNEALRVLDALVHLAVVDKDLATPPESPEDGARYIVAASPTGAWAGHASQVAAWQDGAWAFYTPRSGWTAWVADESESYLFSGGGWIPAPGGGGASLVPKGAWSAATTYATGDLVEHDGCVFVSNIDDNLNNEPDAETPASTSEWTYFAVISGGGGGGGEGGGSVNPTPLVDVNVTADTTNRLSVSSPASLFSHDGDDHQIKINKADAGDTGSVLFQCDFSGRAEFGLTGDDNFHVKVSPNGSAWTEAMVVNRATGGVTWGGTQTFGNNALNGTTVSSLADDAVYSFEPGINGGLIFIAGASLSQVNMGVIIFFRMLSGTEFATILTQPASMFATMNATVLTGTTGTDGKMTVSCSGGNIYIENRLGGARAFRYIIFGN